MKKLTEIEFDQIVEDRLNKIGKTLIEKGLSEITTEIYALPTPPFYYAEEEHQQYLAKNPNGYCNLRGTGISCAIGS